MNKILIATLFCFVSLGLTSCLKEDTPLSKKQSNNVIEIYADIPSPTKSVDTAVHVMYAQAFAPQPEVEFDLKVAYSGAGVAPQDITVVLDIDPVALADFNAEQDTEHELMTNDLFSVDNWTFVIKKGERIATKKVKFYIDKFGYDVSWVLPLKVVSTTYGEISRNYGTVLYNILQQNKYDGMYEVTGKLTDANGVYVGVYPLKVRLETVSGNANNYVNNDYDYFYYLIKNATTGGLSYLFFPRLVFNLDTDKVTNIVWADDGTAVSGLVMDESAPNRFIFPKEAEKEVLHLKYKVGTRWTVEEFWEYVGER